jgi:PKD repeat protein
VKRLILLNHTVFGRSVLFLCSILLSVVAKGQLVADFSANTTRGCAPLVVRFADKSSGNPTSWLWDLGNGNNNIAQQNPTAIYSSPGNYTVKLIIKNTSGTDSVIKTQFIVVGDKPVLNFSVNDSTGCVPVNVQFTDQSAEQLVKWEWDFGDGQTSSLQSPFTYLHYRRRVYGDLKGRKQ